MTTDDQQQGEEEKAQEGAVEGVETAFTEESPQQQGLGSFAQRNWPWIAVVILIISGAAYYFFNRRR